MKTSPQLSLIQLFGLILVKFTLLGVKTAKKKKKHRVRAQIFFYFIFSVFSAIKRTVIDSRVFSYMFSFFFCFFLFCNFLSIAQTEYMDLGTLWDRVNDAVNTIIRRDESTETGELLPPCIEGTRFFLYWMS